VLLETQRTRRGRRAAVLSAVAVLCVLGAAALAFSETLREKWHLWRLEKGDAGEQKAAMTALGTMGSLSAIEPLARRVATLPPESEWHFSTFKDVSSSLEALSALLSIVQARREESIPFLEAARRGPSTPTAKNVFRQLVLVARGLEATVSISRPMHPGSPVE
jgi:hypothetical protein